MDPRPPEPSSPEPSGAAPPPRGRGLFGTRVISLGRPFGIRVGVDSSWVVLLVVIGGLVGMQLAANHPGWNAALVIGVAALGSVAFFASILLHELGHATVAHRLGLPVVAVTIYLFGGVAQHGTEARSPLQAMLVALAGPMVSLILFLGFLAFGIAIPDEGLAGSALRQLAFTVATINFLVLSINVLPGLPLDGGYALRALVWAFTGSEARGTRAASAMGGVIALGLIGGGVVALVALQNALGLWLVLFGWLMLRAARSTALQLVVKSVLGHVRVRDVMKEKLLADRWSTVADLQEVMSEERRPVFIQDDGGLLGWMTPDTVLAVPPRKRPFTQVASVLVPLTQVARIAAERTLLDALEQMKAHGARELAVEQDEEIVGALTHDQLIEVLRARGGVSVGLA